MADDVGPFRTEAKLSRALARDRRPDQRARDATRSATAARSTCDALDWFDLRNMLTVARVVTQAALARTESRGAHQREDFPGMLPEWRVNQVARLDGGRIELTSVTRSRPGRSAMSRHRKLQGLARQRCRRGPLGALRRAV